jgi:hypothetical protein
MGHDVVELGVRATIDSAAGRRRNQLLKPADR